MLSVRYYIHVLVRYFTPLVVVHVYPQARDTCFLRWLFRVGDETARETSATLVEASQYNAPFFRCGLITCSIVLPYIRNCGIAGAAGTPPPRPIQRVLVYAPTGGGRVLVNLACGGRRNTAERPQPAQMCGHPGLLTRSTPRSMPVALLAYYHLASIPRQKRLID